MKTVLVDLTTLNTSRRLRGFGRHVRELSLGLSRLSATCLEGLHILGLTAVDASGRFETVTDLGCFEGSPHIRDATVIDDERTLWQRRIGLWRVAQKLKADIVHVPDPISQPWGLGRGPKRLYTCHDLAKLRRLGSPNSLAERAGLSVRKRLAALRFGTADHVIAISSYTAQDLRQILNIEPSRISVVYNGVDLEKWSPHPCMEDDKVLSAFGLRRNAYALYVGIAAWRKNISGLLRGVRRARELRPELGLQLGWAGRLQALEANTIDREARALGIRHAVHLLNYVSDPQLAALYRCAAAHLLVSRHEGFGLTVVEAMACGCPVITTRRTALAEVAGDAAVGVDPDDHDGIGEAIVRVATDGLLRSELRERGLARVSNFSNDRQARDTVAVYRRVLEG